MSEIKYVRPTWDDYFMEISRTVAKRATCDRGRSGCVIAKDHQILVTGYVGSPSGLPHCDDVGHFLKKTIHEDGSVTQHCVRTVHAEQNAMLEAARKDMIGATMYLAGEEEQEFFKLLEVKDAIPCPICQRMICNSGIERVINRKGIVYEKEVK